MSMYPFHKEYCLPFVIWFSIFWGLQCQGIGYQKPINCAYLECPAYDVVHTRPEFEIRAYMVANWMAFPVIGSKSFKDSSTKGFLQLFDYISGNNGDRKNMSITAPVLVDIGTSNGSIPYIVYYYLPKLYQDNPPLPISKVDHQIKLPPKKFAAVRRFGGFSNDKKICIQALALKQYLRGTPWESASKVELYSQAGYNAPYERNNRVNEIIIWFD